MTRWHTACCIGLCCCLLAGCGTPGEFRVSVNYDMNPTPPAVSVTVDQFTWFSFGHASMSVSTTGAATASVTVYLP
ncbi:MAG: hypothetical protein OXJ90_17200 [Spirochaetaceae bacterium]|nr:hypothetical protein [Spirochaetaceae bacterium]